MKSARGLCSSSSAFNGSNLSGGAARCGCSRTAGRPQQTSNVREVNDGNVAYTRHTARKVNEWRVYDFANSPYRPKAGLAHGRSRQSTLWLSPEHLRTKYAGERGPRPRLQVIQMASGNLLEGSVRFVKLLACCTPNDRESGTIVEAPSVHHRCLDAAGIFRHEPIVKSFVLKTVKRF